MDIIRTCIAITLLCTVFLFSNIASAASVWTTYFEEESFSNTFALHIISSSDVELTPASILGAYLDNTTFGQSIEPNQLLSNTPLEVYGLQNTLYDLYTLTQNDIIIQNDPSADYLSLSINFSSYWAGDPELTYVHRGEVDFGGIIMPPGASVSYNGIKPSTEFGIVFPIFGGGANVDRLVLSASHLSTVPIPQAAWLFCSGLIGMIGIARLKKAA